MCCCCANSCRVPSWQSAFFSQKSSRYSIYSLIWLGADFGESSTNGSFVRILSRSVFTICVAEHCSVLQRGVVCCSVLPCVVEYCSVLQYVIVHCSVLQCVAVCFSVNQYILPCCSVLKYAQTQKQTHRHTDTLTNRHIGTDT